MIKSKYLVNQIIKLDLNQAQLQRQVITDLKLDFSTIRCLNQEQVDLIPLVFQELQDFIQLEHLTIDFSRIQNSLVLCHEDQKHVRRAIINSFQVLQNFEKLTSLTLNLKFFYCQSMGIQESSIINGLLKVVEQLQLDDLTILANADQDIDPIQFQNTLYNQGKLKKLKLQLNTKNKQVLTEALIDILPKFQHLETFVFENNNLNFTEKNNKIFHKFFKSFLLLSKLKNLELRLFNMSYEINLLRQDMLYAAKILGSLEHIESIIFDAGYGINQKIVNSALLSINHQQFIQNMDQNLGCKRLKHLELKGFSPLLDYYSKLFVEKKKKEKFLIHAGFKLYTKKIFRKEILHEALHTLITDFVTLKTEK